MVSGLLSIFAPSGYSATISEFLDSTSFDELVEIDLAANRCKSIVHMKDKYFAPITDGSFTNLYDYSVDNMVYPDDRDIFAQLFDPDTLSQRLGESDIPGAISAQFRYRLQDGGWRWSEVCIVGDGRQGLPKGIVRFYVFDIETIKRREQGIYNSNQFKPKGIRDEKTGLLHEWAFLEQVNRAVESDPAMQYCLIVIDIDHFKLFNEWYGREKGDFLLAEIGGRLAEEEQECNGLGAYLGKDDFCLFVPYDQNKIHALFDDLANLVASHGTAAGFAPVFGISVAEKPLPGYELLDQAFMAAKSAKSDFKKRICLFKQPMREQEEKEYRTLAEFLHGLDAGELFFQLQPQCKAATGKIVGAEALARWRKADGTLVPPFDFVPVLEQHGFITSLDCYIWEEVCIWLRSWIDGGHTPIPISVNVSPVDFYMIDVADHFETLAKEYGLPASLIKVEITESAYMDNTSVVNDAVARLRKRGFLVFMDDFGSGYSSLNTLSSLSFDAIKLDAQFLHLGKGVEHKGIHILESVINMAKAMGLPIISEGVETEEQSVFLQEQGCSYVQGYRFYRPMDVSKLEKIIAEEQSIDTGGLVARANEQFRTRELIDENVYSDSMLNSILGAVALYSWHGDDVDIVRFNDQFYKTVNARDFHKNLAGIQRLMPRGEVPKLYNLLAAAEADQLNGANGVLEFTRFSGEPCRYLFRFYYLGEKDCGKRFYGSVRDVTELTELQNQMKLISRFSSDTVVFLRHIEDIWKFSVIVHGTKDALGLSRAELQDELDSMRILDRVDDATRRQLTEMTHASENESASLQFKVTNVKGQPIELHLRIDAVNDPSSDVTAIFAFRSV